jgi:hypothetical protein
MVKKKQVLAKKTLKKASSTSKIKKKNTAKPSSVKVSPKASPKTSVKSLVKKSSSTLVKKTPSKDARHQSAVKEAGETNAQKIWREKKRDYWRDQFGQLLASLPAKGKGRKQAPG